MHFMCDILALTGSLGTRWGRQFFDQRSLVDSVLSMASHSNITLRKEAIYTLANAVTQADKEHLKKVFMSLTTDSEGDI